jgi:hypothetical protein
MTLIKDSSFPAIAGIGYISKALYVAHSAIKPKRMARETDLE